MTNGKRVAPALSLLYIPTILAALATAPPARAGETFRKVNYEDPREPGKRVWAWRKQTHGLLYRVTKGPRAGELVTFHPHKPEVPRPNHADLTSEQEEADRKGKIGDEAFMVQAKILGLRLVTRNERREMFRAERKRYKRIVAARKAAERNTPETSSNA